MVQERSRAAAVARALAWALALAAAWLLLALIAPPDRAAAEPLARDLGSLVGDTVDDALDAVGDVEDVAQAVVAQVPIASVPAAPVAPAPAPAAVAVPAPLPPAPAAPAPAIADPHAVIDVASAVTASASAAASLLSAGSVEELTDAAAALLGPVGPPVLSILAPIVGVASPAVDPVLGLVDRVSEPVLDSILPPLVAVIDGVDALPPPAMALPPIAPVAPGEGTAAPPVTTGVLLAESLIDRSPRAQATAPLAGDPLATNLTSVAGPASFDALSGAPALGGGVMPPASAAASTSASGSPVLGVVGFLLPLALLRGSFRLGRDADVPIGPAREHAPSPD